MLHKAMQNKGARIAIAVFATLLYALGVNLFIVPVGLYSGGMVGLSQVIRTVLTERVALPAGVDIAGILYFLLNVPMLIIGWKELGRGFLVRTLICVGASSFFLSVIPAPALCSSIFRRPSIPLSTRSSARFSLTGDTSRISACRCSSLRRTKILSCRRISWAASAAA